MIRADLAFRGTVVVAALLIDPALLGEAEARRRVLAVYRAGATVRATPYGYLVSTALRVDAREALGAPVRMSSGYLTTLPLAAEEIHALGAPTGSLILAVAGELLVHDLRHAPLVDPSLWIDCGSYAVAPVEAPPLRFAELERERLAAPVDPLATLVPRDGSEGGKAARLALLRAERRTREEAEGAVGHASGDATGESGWLIGGLAAALGLLAGFLSLLGAGLGALFGAGPSSAGADEAGGLVREAPSPGLFTRWSRALEALASRLLLSTRLGQLIGRKHAQYFEEMFDAFARKDFDEALKRAIPLGGEAGAGGFETLFGTLSKRGALTITPRLGAPAGSFGVGAVGYQSLREMYRAAFEALDARGDVDRASFVLAELLRENGEAVAYLERHGRFRLAAELAEHRRLESGLVVRLWFLAGDVAHAVQLARRDHAFASAVLSAEHAAQAEGAAGRATELAKATRALRATWMDTLAEAGDLEGAASVALPDPVLRPFAVAFWRRAREAGGVQGGRSLAHALLEGERADPASGEDIVASAERLLASGPDEREGAAEEERAGFVAVLAGAEKRTASVAAQRMARRAVRQSLGARGPVLSRQTLEGLIGVGGDVLLQADLPPRIVREEALPQRVSLQGVASPGVAFFGVALLPGERRLLAAGPHGVFLVDRRGRPLARFDTPARSVVVSDAGTRALAIDPTSDERSRVSRIDLVGRRAEPWTELRLDAFCRSFDGDTWLVSDGRQLISIDCLGERAAPLGKVPLPDDGHQPGRWSLWRARGTTHALTEQWLLSAEQGRLGLRQTRLEGLTLRSTRDFEVGALPCAGTDGRVEWLSSDAALGSWLSRVGEGGARGDARQHLLGEGFEVKQLRAEPRCSLVHGRRGRDAVLLIIAGDHLRTLLEVTAPDAGWIVASETLDGHVAVADDRGRSGVFALPMLA